MDGRIERINWKSLGVLDLIPQLDQGQNWAADSLLKCGTLEPPNGGSRSMRDACMPAEGCAYYHAMTGDSKNLQAACRAVETFRKYRHIARIKEAPYEELGPGQTIVCEMGGIHVGRNTRGMRAVAHLTGDEQLMREVEEELMWWIDSDVYNHQLHQFPSSVDMTSDGKAVQSEMHRGHYVLNMTGSLAVAMWLVGSDLGNQRLCEYAEDHILNNILAKQYDDGYWPYSYTDEDPTGVSLAEILRLDNYSIITFTLLTMLLQYPRWREEPQLVQRLDRAGKYIRGLTCPSGVVNGQPDIEHTHGWIMAGKHWHAPKPLWHMTADSALGFARIHRYLGDHDAFAQAGANLRWLHHNSPLCIPFLPGDHKIGSGLLNVPTGGGYSHAFREIVMTAYEGFHLRQNNHDVEPVFVITQPLEKDQQATATNT